jgi:D-3-phosphoglycerate dehydrogenase
MPKILIVDRVLPLLSEQLSAQSYECETNRGLSHNDFMALPDEYDGLIIRNRFQLDAAAIDSKPHLRFVVRIGSGMENIDTQYAESKGIKCLNTPDGNANAVAELCLTFLLAALRHLATADQEVRQGQWLREKNKGTELASHTVGIIGYGHTGPAFAKLLKKLGCKVLCYDCYRKNYGDENATAVSLQELFEQCDVISLHINYLPENHYFINKKTIDKIKHPFIFINSSRGWAVNTADVLTAIKEGKIQYACFDVLEYESSRLQIPPKEEWDMVLQELAETGCVLLSPHVGGQTFEAEKRHAELAVKKILALYSEY